jgi:hypothetical protein
MLLRPTAHAHPVPASRAGERPVTESRGENENERGSRARVDEWTKTGKKAKEGLVKSATAFRGREGGGGWLENGVET